MLDKNNIPKHVAIIMDGNGRWAKERGLPRSAGHHAGIARVKEVIKAASDLGIKVVTLFTFSTENWSRAKREINLLMHALNNFLDRQINELDKNNIRLMVIGQDSPIPQYLLAKIKKAKEKTKDNTGLIFVLALNYGSRQEIVDAVKKFTNAVIKDEANLEGLDMENFSNYLYTAGLPDPDLLIRTSGEMRISNFLLWQLSYAELYFPRKYWPDFGKEDLEKAIEIYQRRERRFGKSR
ncbi:MAG: isoprenyl transferase [Candidatus Omnitrophica bacterium CG23_combo_of_CG06-09_8_20_14_all_40_11]|nr:MAG: isoprenyl transferase [Candidatus Omnitrophica bacterium CG23_combo_of_CG06-09_8_20_14_all_40_11]